MKTGIILIGHRSGGAEESLLNEFRMELESRGRRNVHVAFQTGSPRPDAVMAEMHREGIDTFSIIPVCVAEGNLTVWRMPKSCGLPDNSGSWTIIGGKDVATRFATALGPDVRMLDAMSRMLGQADGSTGILLVMRGSRLSMARKTADYYASGLEQAGWKSACCLLNHSDTSLSESIGALMQRGCTKVRIIPMFVSMDGPSALKIMESGCPAVSVETEISRLPEFLEIMDSKIPEGW